MYMQATQYLSFPSFDSHLEFLKTANKKGFLCIRTKIKVSEKLRFWAKLRDFYPKLGY